MTKPLVELINIDKIYNPGLHEVRAADAISLAIMRGEFTAIAGPSGSGKTTLLNLIGCLDSPTAGEILIAGQSVVGLNNRQQARIRNEKIGFIFQQFNLIPVLTAFENVELAVQISTTIPHQQRREKIENLLKLVGLGEMMHRKPAELSGGQQQRVAIARALVKEPELVLADEPTANLDSQTATDILILMEKLNHELSTTFIFSTHDLMVMDYARRIIKLRDGRIVQIEEKGHHVLSREARD
ncbi:ABC transporter ATP-binding protein [candidate division CSSED10-310 bacterium]|uniref:ABC transporter ATP-binding protein n=1 Tax=candidate division CSSED10-310 bacterium TaxID=2855610 RepID=A0ABV6YS80_UNCC1